MIFFAKLIGFALAQRNSFLKVVENTNKPFKLDFTILKLHSENDHTYFSMQDGYRWNKRDPCFAKISSFKDVIYLVDIFLGSGQQKVVVLLDTGSSDLWVPHTEYDPTLSNSSKPTNETFEIGYLDGTVIEGKYFMDQLKLGGQSPSLFNFKFARARGHSMGVLGISNRAQQASEKPYDNFPWALKAAGIIPKASYSLFLGPSNKGGSVIFGGIDTEKYWGKLTKYNISKEIMGLGIDLKLVSVNGQKFTLNTPVIFDSGTSLAFLPGEIINELDAIFNTTTFYHQGIEYRHTSCDQPTDKTLDFDFGNNVISLTYKEAVVEQEDGTCVLGFAYYQNMQLLGDVFLRKAYVYYDLSEQTISLANAKYSNLFHIISA